MEIDCYGCEFTAVCGDGSSYCRKQLGKEYIYRADVTRHNPPQPPIKEVEVFGTKLKVYDDTWRNHLHVISTYRCNANCSFCVEKDSKCREVNLTSRLIYVLDEMANAGILHTVSFTGGEPGLDKGLRELVGLIPDGIFKTVNTNGSFLWQLSTMGFDWINISRHYIDEERNREVFGCLVPGLGYIKDCREVSNSKFRLQAVVNEDTRIEDYLGLIERGVCDDVSFRSIMLDGSKSASYYHNLYLALIDSALNAGSKVIEQEIQDYYVYEVHQIDGKNLTFSYSNMQAALQEDIQGTTDLIREFVLRPDGTLSGSWQPGARMILR